MSAEHTVDRQAIHAELDRATEAFHHLLDNAEPIALKRPTDGTRWTNEQLLYHMLFGYLVARTLLVVFWTVSRTPNWFARGFAAALDAANRPFHHVNYWGSRGGARVLGAKRMGRRFDRVTASLHKHLDAVTERELARGMYMPDRWDPYFNGRMTTAELYRYPTLHFEYHRRQLTL